MAGALAGGVPAGALPGVVLQGGQLPAVLSEY